MLDPTSLSGMFMQYGRSLLWAITAAIGFGLGVGISLKVFDMLSTDIDEWEEIKKGNMGVSIIFVSLIVSKNKSNKSKNDCLIVCFGFSPWAGRTITVLV